MTVTNEMIDSVEERLKAPPECDQEELSQDIFSEISA